MHRAIAGIALEDQSLPRGEGSHDERAGADRTMPVGVAFGLDRFARDTCQQRHREKVGECRIGHHERDAQRVTIECDETGNRRVVVDAATGVLRALRECVEPFDLAREHRLRRRPQLRVEHATDRVPEIRSDELARLALEARVRGEENARPHANRVDAVVRRDVGQRSGGNGNECGRRRERVEPVQRVVDARRDDQRLSVVDPHRIEGFRHQRYADAHDAGHRGRTGRAPGDERRKDDGHTDSREGPHVRAAGETPAQGDWPVFALDLRTSTSVARIDECAACVPRTPAALRRGIQ